MVSNSRYNTTRSKSQLGLLVISKCQDGSDSTI